MGIFYKYFTEKGGLLMIKKIPSERMWNSNLHWLKGKFHFSFGEYYNEKNINFGVLKVVNDEILIPKTGFKTHPHRDMEIISYVVKGKLSHEDSIGKKAVVEKGEVQYMSAGTGIFHSEHNNHSENLRFIQLWILPDKTDSEPFYKNFKFDWNKRCDKFFHIVSNKNGNAPVKINQDINIFVTELSQEKTLDLEIKEKRQGYVVQIEGKSIINGVELSERDALKTIGSSLKITSIKKSHILIIEMKERQDLK